MERITCNVDFAGLPVRIGMRSPELPELMADFAALPQTDALDIFLTEAEWQDAQQRFGPESGVAGAEVAGLCRKTANMVLEHDRFLIHGVAFIWRGKAYLLSAPSGTGKTTQYVLWKMCYGDEISILNGDKPFLRLMQDGSVWVCPSPWKGKEMLGTPQSAPLGGVILLIQGSENNIREASPAEALVKLRQQIIIEADTEREVDGICRCLEALLRTPVWHFTNRGDEASAVMAHDYILAQEVGNDAL